MSNDKTASMVDAALMNIASGVNTLILTTTHQRATHLIQHFIAPRMTPKSCNRQTLTLEYPSGAIRLTLMDSGAEYRHRGWNGYILMDPEAPLWMYEHRRMGDLHDFQELLQYVNNQRGVKL